MEKLLEKNKKIEDVKVAIFLPLVGNEGVNLQSIFPEQSKHTLENLINEFDKNFVP